MNYCRTLKFEEKPDYRFLRKLFRDLAERIGLPIDYRYDWTLLPARKQIATNTLSLFVEKEGEEIAVVEKEGGDRVREEDVRVELLNSRCSGSENVPEESMYESEGLCEPRRSL